MFVGHKFNIYRMTIKRFNSVESDTLYIFDFDNTLAESPSFEELAIEFLKESSTIESMLKSSIAKIGVLMGDLKWENGRIYVNDPKRTIKTSGNWIRKGNRVYLFAPNEYSFSDVSMPSKLKELSDMYSNVEDKCIVTARPENVRSKIIRVMINLGLEMPKFGLHMFPLNEKNAGIWKGKKIVEILKETGFKKAHFFDDNSKIINRASRVVKDQMPDIKLETTRVK